MSSPSEKRGEAGGDQIPQKLLDFIQPLDTQTEQDPQQSQTPTDSTSEQLPMQNAYGNAAVAQAETTSATTFAALIVDDNVDVLEPGQMKKSEFLTTLKAAVCSSAEEALANTQWSALGCPYLDQWFSHYDNQSGNYIEKAIRRYAPETAASTSASGYIPAIAARVRRSVTTWATTGQLAGVPPGVSVPENASGPPSDVAGAASRVTGAVASAVSGVPNLLFKQDAGGTPKGADPHAVQDSLGEGQALDAGIRSRMEQAFGESFSGVQVHTDSNAAQISENLSARALTVGNHIAFARGEYQPGNLISEALLAHELSHVLQQRGAGESTQRNDSGSSESNALEEAADRSAVAAVVSLWGGPVMRGRNVARNAMPRLRSGLRLSRCGCSGKTEPLPEPIPADPHAEYEKRLNEAVYLLKDANFGACFLREGDARPPMFDDEYWFFNPKFRAQITLRSGKRPSDAIDAMFRKLGEWKFDCAQFVQVAQWYAMRHAYGADEFNKRVGLPFHLKLHESTGINYREVYSRDSKTEKMKRFTDKAEEPRSVEELVTDAPIGSLITWSNKKAPTSSAFRNENTIKLGPDQFAAHGFGQPRNVFTRAELELRLARAADPSADATYVAENIFIADIAYFDTP